MKNVHRYHKMLFPNLREMVKLSICLLITSVSFSQTVNDVLEKGNCVKKESDIYFKLDSVLRFGVLNKKNAGKQPIDYEYGVDSVLFLTWDDNTEVFIKPLNPLNFIVSSASKLVPDEISKNESDALKAIRTLLITANNENVKSGAAGGSSNYSKKQLDSIANQKAWEIRSDQIKSVERGLSSENDHVKAIAKAFKDLKKLDFEQQTTTRNEFTLATKNKEQIEMHLFKMDSIIKLLEADSKEFKKEATPSDEIILRYALQDYVKSLREAYSARKKQLDNLVKAVDLVEKTLKNAEANHWQIKLRPISVTKTENAIYTVTIDTNAWNMSEEGNLVQKSEGKNFSRVIVIRKFQLLVPETSIGTYYTFFNYKVYGTTTDSTGQQFVAEPTFSTLKRFNASVMLNYNFYIPRTPVKPLLQFGGGIQSGIPVLMAGGGLRIGNSNTFSITGGIAMTWMRELQTLEVGDRVSGTAELEQDLKYEFSFPLKGYIGVQYNF